jgi:hypothetical protein
MCEPWTKLQRILDIKMMSKSPAGKVLNFAYLDCLSLQHCAVFKVLCSSTLDSKGTLVIWRLVIGIHEKQTAHNVYLFKNTYNVHGMN